MYNFIVHFMMEFNEGVGTWLPPQGPLEWQKRERSPGRTGGIRGGRKRNNRGEGQGTDQAGQVGKKGEG